MNRIIVKLMIGAALLAVGFGPSAATAEISSELAERLLMDRTNQYIAERGYYLSDDNTDYFRSSYRETGDYIADYSPHDQPSVMAKATESYRILVDVMILEAQGMQGYGNRLGEQTLAGALAALCPLWPFCD